MWHQRYSNETTSRIPSQTLLTSLGQCDKNFYPNIFTLLKIFATLPITTSTSERSFSTLRRIKHTLRNVTGQDWLNGLPLLNIYKESEVSSRQVLQERKKTLEDCTL
jgi:hypothetical protein